MPKIKTPTMSDVARLTGFSSMTVSRALRADTSTSDETRIKILDAADKLGYVLDGTAAGLSSRKTGFVAVIIPSINNANFAFTVRGLTEGLRNSGLQVLLGYTDYKMDEEERLVKTLLTRRPEALVITGGVHTERCRQYLYSSGVPIVEMWDSPPSPIDHVVGFSNARAGRIMARHLYDQGYRKIGFIGGDTDSDIRGADRRRGFVETISDFGLGTDRLWQSDQPVLTMAGGAKAMHDLLDQYPATDAVMCASDLSAFGAMMTCQKRGLTIPDDIAIAGFGAYDISANALPEITTIDVGARGIGTQVAEVIKSSLADKTHSKDPANIDIPTRLIVRKSTAG